MALGAFYCAVSRPWEKVNEVRTDTGVGNIRRAGEITRRRRFEQKITFTLGIAVALGAPLRFIVFISLFANRKASRSKRRNQDERERVGAAIDVHHAHGPPWQ